MNRRLAKLLIVIMVVAVSWAPAASAVGGGAGVEALAGIHTTASDFQNATTLTGMSIRGAGDSAYIELNPVFSDSFDNEPADSGVPDGWEGYGDSGLVDAWGVTDQVSTDGPQSFYIKENDGELPGIRPQSQPYDTAKTNDVTVSIYENASDSSGQVRLRLLESGTRRLMVTMLRGDLKVYNGAYVTISTVPDSGEWVDITVTNINPQNDSATIEWATATASGSKTVSVEGDMQNGYTSTVLEVNNHAGRNYFDDFKIGAAVTDGTYISDSIRVDQATQAFVDLQTVNNVEVNLTVQGSNDDTSWTNVSKTRYTSAGNKSVTLTGSYDYYRVRVDVSQTATTRSFELADDGILKQTYTPELDESTASPSGGEAVNTQSVTLSIDLSDQDFPTTQSDSVTVDFYNAGGDGAVGGGDDTLLGTETRTANGTASTTWDHPDGGTNSWYAVATDSYGNSVTTQTFEFKYPGTLYIRNVSNASDLVDGSINVTVRFFGENRIVTRTVSDGTVNMTGLNVSSEFIVAVNASANYYGRTVYLPGILEQDSVYLLNKSRPAIESRFTLDDPTGQYGPSTILVIQKPIERNGTTKYRTVVADRFGIEGVTAVLEQNVRYRVKLRDGQGTVIDIGPYRATTGETVTVRPGTPSIDPGKFTDGWAANAVIDNDTITFTYRDPAKLTSSLKVWVHERGNKSNILGTNRTYTDLGNVTGTYSLTKNQTSEEWVVNFEIDRDGESYSVFERVANRPTLVPNLSREWRLIVAIPVYLISAVIFSEANAYLGGTVVALEGGLLWYTGWLSGVGTAAGVTIGLFVAAGYHMYKSGERY